MNELLSPHKVWSRGEVLASPCPVPRLSGVYAWYFREVPDGVPVKDCLMFEGLTLLYAGISPKALPRNGRLPSTQTLYDRIRQNISSRRICWHSWRARCASRVGMSLASPCAHQGSGRLLTEEAPTSVAVSWSAWATRQASGRHWPAIHFVATAIARRQLRHPTIRVLSAPVPLAKRVFEATQSQAKARPDRSFLCRYSRTYTAP